MAVTGSGSTAVSGPTAPSSVTGPRPSAMACRGPTVEAMHPSTLRSNAPSTSGISSGEPSCAKIVRTLLVGTVLAVGDGAVALAADAPNPDVGTWTLNLAKSKFSPRSEEARVGAKGQSL